jgi:hypothetical protein
MRNQRSRAIVPLGGALRYSVFLGFGPIPTPAAQARSGALR